MIVSGKRRYVHIAIPKTGSATVRDWLREFYDGQEIGAYHDWHVPERFAGYSVFTVVRNPYERCFSWWWFGTREPARRERMGESWEMAFQPYMERLIRYRDHGNPDHRTPEAFMTQAEYVRKSGAEHVLHLEHLAEEIEILPFVENPPPMRYRRRAATKPRVSFAEYFGRRDEELVWDYCAEDFEAFGYDRLVM